MATRHWGRTFAVGGPNYEIVEGPGEWQMFVDGLRNGQVLCFTVRDRQCKKPSIVLRTQVTGAWPDTNGASRCMWFFQVLILGTTDANFEPEEAVFYYRIRSFPGTKRQSKGHITCFEPFNPS